MEKDTAESVTKRRRRRGRAPVEVVAHAQAPAPARRSRFWPAETLSSFGISPIFRAYIFLGSIVTILAFLLYNESLTNELREQEKNRVGLYARLISFAPLASVKSINSLHFFSTSPLASIFSKSVSGICFVSPSLHSK